MALIDNLVSYWKLDEESGTRVDAHSTNTNDLTDNNTVLFGAGIISNAADFESANSESLTITDAAQTGLDITGDLSYSCWINFESTPTTDNGMAISAKWGALANRSYYFLLLNNGGTLQLGFFSHDGSSGVFRGVNWTPSLATWYHVAVVYTAAGGTADFYVDGAQQGAQQSGLQTALNSAAGTFAIGQTNTTPADFMDGLIDELGIWDRALTASEISDLYNGGAGLAYPLSSGTTVFPQPTLLTLGVG